MTTLREKLAALRLRIGAAESQRDTWKAAGSQEKYLEACSLVDALELQLATLEQSTEVVAQPTSPQHSDAAVASEMAELSIRFDGRAYHYGQYRYDRFMDAVNYARLEHERGVSALPAEDALEQMPLPTDADRALMQALGISFQDGAFRWREYRYDRLADALAYATRHGGSKPTVAD